ncbi:MAG TPA: carboxypeptidase regulatory-like domain-containing protein [Candidatus Binatia bacterium]|nr:carboxypeptidase regulatory-like domain-containing protein [Candidatus Binatia bacterium]
MKSWKDLLLAFVFLLSNLAAAQTAPATNAVSNSGALRGQVNDPSGAAIPNANLSMAPASGGAALKAQSDGQGAYEFRGVAPGKYSLTVAAPGFATYLNNNVVVGPQAMRLNVEMAIQVEEEKVQVSDTAPTVDVNPENNAGAIVISGKELEALPDDPDELLTDLQALAGPSAGPNGGQIYIDGFTAGQLPPKSSIREIRINQNPFSAEYDKLGYGRIEIFTKPGTDQYHGQAYVIGNDSAFNSPNPFGGANQPGYDTTQYSLNFGGPINRKASFFIDSQRRNIADLSAVDAFELVNGAQFNLLESVPNPRHRTNITPRIDYQLSKNNTLTVRYQYYHNTEGADGVGQFNLASQAYNTDETEHTLQISDTQIFGGKIVNETRFQYLRELNNQFALNSSPTINVPGALGAGGNSQGDVFDHQDHYELQNYTSIVHGSHTIKFGARLRGVRDANTTTSGFNGTFTFSSLLPNSQQSPCTPSAGAPPCPIPYSTYASAGGVGTTPIATQLSYTCKVGSSGCAPGTPAIVVNNFDAGLYYQDDWKVRSNITFSYGLRYEMQTGISDHADWAPRIGLAWGVGGKSAPPKVVIRGGFGIFYDRFQVAQILEAQLLNGATQEQFVINNPVCPSTDIFSCTGYAAPAKTAIYQISPRLHAPYTMQSAISVERQLTKSATLNVTYLNSRGFDQLLTINANAPYPGTPCPPCSTPTGGNLYQYVSGAVFRQNQLIANTNIRASSKIQLFGYYVLNYANSDTGGVSTFPSNSHDISQDYGRASFDTRNRLFFGGSLALPRNFRISPFMVVSSGTPFNITTANDLNNDSIFNDRPGFVSTATCPNGPPTGNAYCTPLGTFDAAPAAGEKLVPINYGTGPAHATVNLRLTKTIGFGPKAGKTSGNQGDNGPRGGPVGGHGGGSGVRGPLFGGGPGGMGGGNTDRRYNLTFGVSARNVFNKVNLASPSGVLGSHFFDLSNQLQQGPFSNGAANRRIDLQATFSF